jgi:hypothetical protein
MPGGPVKGAAGFAGPVAGAGVGGAGGLIRAALAAASLVTFSAAAAASAVASASASSRKCFRTFSAAATSIELECVFFSLTPASGK